MQIRIAILASIIAMTSCISQTSANYADSLNGCLSDKDVLLLNEACKTFEVQLTNRYSGLELGQAYKAFLQDIQTMNIAPSFFLNSDSKELIGRIKNSNTFDKVWTKLSSAQTDDIVMPYSPNGQQEKADNGFDPYCINPNGAYLNCLMTKNHNKTIADYLESVKSAADRSPGLVAGALEHNVEKDLTRLIIAIGLYYEIGLLLEQR